MSIQLKIKSKHLSLESKVIRYEEKKLLKQAAWLRKHQESTSKVEAMYDSLSNHRKKDVRNENRATFLARAYINGKKYSEVERCRKESKELTFKSLVLPRVLSMVNKYHDRDATIGMLRHWIEG
jgi:hypothetical protein